MEYGKPLPEPTEVSAEFWKALKRHELCIQHCQNCGSYVFYPRTLCPQCFGINLRWERVSGHGKVYSYTIVHRAGIPGFEKDVPYVFAIVELEEGPRMTTNIIGVEPEKVRIDMEVESTFDDITPEITLLKFKPRSSNNSRR